MGATDGRLLGVEEAFNLFLDGGGAVALTLTAAAPGPDRYVSTAGTDMAHDVDARTGFNVVSEVSRSGFRLFPEDQNAVAILVF
jgi:hypothetical protein